jgi:DNA primase
VFASLTVFSNKPDYSLETWQKEIAGVPKYKIDEYYRGMWGKLEPQLKGRNILVRYEHGGEQVVRRHPPGKDSYTTINDVDTLSEIVREHGIELWPETSKKGDLGRADMLVIDIDNMGGVSESRMKDVSKAVYDKMYDSIGITPYIVSTHGGYHVVAKLDEPIPYNSLRRRVNKDIIIPLEKDLPFVSGKHGKTDVFLDKTPIKIHGSTRAYGSLNLPDLGISEKLSIQDIDDYKMDYLR